MGIPIKKLGIYGNFQTPGVYSAIVAAIAVAVAVKKK